MTQIAAVLSITAALLLTAIGILAIQRRHRTDVPAIGGGLRHRTNQAALGISIAIAIIISALPAAIFPNDTYRFQRLYGPLGQFIQAATQALVVAIIIVGIIVLFRDRAIRSKDRK